MPSIRMPAGSVKPLMLSAVIIASRGTYLLFILCLARIYGASGTTDPVFVVAATMSLFSSLLVGLSDAVSSAALHRARLAGREHLLLHYLYPRYILLAVGFGLVASVWLHFRQSMSVMLYSLSVLPLLVGINSLFAARLVAAGRLQRSQLSYLPAGMVVIPAVFLMPHSQSAIITLMILFELIRGLFFWWQLADTGDYPGTVKAKQNGEFDWVMRPAVGQLTSHAISAMPPLIGLYIAQSYGNGYASLLEYLNKLWVAVLLLFSGYLLHLFYRFNAQVHDHIDHAYIQRSVCRMLVVSLLMVPVVPLGCWFLMSYWFRSDGWAEALRHSWVPAGFIYSLALPAYLVGLIFVRLANARLQSRPILLTVSANLIAYVFVVSISWKLGVIGLALAHVAGQYAQLAILYTLWRKELSQ